MRAAVSLARRRTPITGVGICRAAAIAVLAYASLSVVLTAFLSKPILDGESGSLLSISLNIAENDRLYHELYGDLLRGVGLETYSVHPPFFYAVAGWLLKIIEQNVTGFLSLNFLAAAVGTIGTSLLLARYYGFEVVVTFLALIAAFSPLLEALTVFRPEMFSGLLNGLVCICTLIVVIGPARQRFAWIALASVFSTAAIATHWYNAPIAGIAAVLVLARVLADRRRLWLGLVSGAVPAILGFLVWNSAYGGQLVGHLRLISSWAGAMRTNIDRAIWPDFFEPAAEDLGGAMLLLGMLVAAVTLLVNLSGAIRRRDAGLGARLLTWYRGLPRSSRLQSDRVTLVLVAFVLGFLCFVALVAGAVNFRYWGNISFIAAALSAIGIGWSTRFLVHRISGRLGFSQEPLAVAAATGIAIAVCFGSTSARTYFTPNILTLQSTSVVHDTVRSTLDRIIPGDAVVLAGSHGYPFVFDRPLESTYTLVLERYVTQTPNLQPALALSRFAREYGDYWTGDRPFTRFTANSFATAAARRSTVIVTNDDCHWWQCIFYQPGAWRSDFRKVASILLVDPYVNGRPKPSVRSVPRVLSVYFRNDVADAYLAEAGLGGTPLASDENGVAVIFTGRTDNRGSEINRDVWLGMDASAKQAEVSRLLADYQWFGLVDDATRRADIVKELVPAVDHWLSAQQGIERSLDQAVDWALSQPAAWCRMRADRRTCGELTAANLQY